jgi:hypothetical protein
MVIVEKRHQPPMLSLRDGSHHHTLLHGIRTTYIVSVSVIKTDNHLLPPTLQPDSSWWYLSNTMDLDGFILLYILIITLDA